MIDRVPATNSQSIPQVSLRSTIDLVELLWRRKRYVIVATGVAICLGFSYWLLATRQYESSADVLVVKKRPAVVTGDNAYESGFEDYLATHLALIVCPLIVERAIEMSDLASLPTFADYVDDPDFDLTDVVIGQLEVHGGSRELGDSADSIMTLSFRGPEPEDCPIVVQAVLDSYESFHREIYHGMSDYTVELISQARDLLKDDLQQQEETYTRFRQQSPLVARGTDEINPLQDRLTAIETQRSELLLRRAEIERQLMAIENARQAGADPEQLLAMVFDLRNLATTENTLPNTSATLESQLIQLVDTEKRLLEHYGPNHPHVMMVRQRIAATRRFFALPSAAYMEEQESHEEPVEGAASRNPVEVYTRYLEQEMERIQISEELLTNLYEREHDAAKELSGYLLKDESFQRGMDRTEQLYDVVVSRLQEASLIKGFGGFETRVIAPPQLGEKVSPAGRIVLPVFTFAGMSCGFLCALFAEFSDKSFRSREEIQTRLGMPVVGQIPQFSAVADAELRALAGDVGLDRMLCTYYQPQARASEAFRSLRTALEFRTRGFAQRIIQVTSPTPQCGATTLAANLAVSIAQAGKRVLVLDADLRNPQQHEVFGVVAPQKGLCSIIACDDEPDDAIYNTVVDNLWLLPTGPLPPGPCELFTSPRFANLIRMVGEKYDYVMIDTGPLLAVSDPCVVASQVGGVLMTVRLTKDSRQQSERAMELLHTLDVRLMGVVVNGIGGAGARGYRDDSYGQGNHSYVNGKPMPRTATQPMR